MSHWSALDEELARWSARGREATLWWRDDDATDDTPALDTLLSLADEAGAGLVLAVIPAHARPALAERLAAHPQVLPVQHGYAHVNHQPAGIKACEFADARGAAALRDELQAGAARLDSLFGGGWLRAFVPPWNRVGEAAVGLLAGLGYRALSTYRPRTSSEVLPGLRQVNCHADVMDWKHTRGFIGTAKVVADIVEHLAARREGSVDADEPTGVLTHHLDHDEGCWHFMRELFERTAAHPAARWLEADEALCRA